MTIQGKENKKKQGNTTESGGTESLVFHREVSVAENSDVGVIIVIILKEGKRRGIAILLFVLRIMVRFP